MTHRPKNPTPKHDYLESRTNSMMLVRTIRQKLEKIGVKDFYIRCEKEKFGTRDIWVVRSNIAEILNLYTA